MGRIKKYLQKQDLDRFQVLVTDDEPNSRFFRLTQFNDILTSGKNSFLINGSAELEPSTEVRIELLDSEGNTVFLQPIRNYQEGNARVISIEIYEDTPPGTALLTIMGELQQMADGSPVPEDWANTYNVKWQKRVTIDPYRQNATPIRLYDRPILTVREILSPVRNAVTGSISESSITDLVGTTQISTEASKSVAQSATFTFQKIMEGGTLQADIGGTSYTGSINRVVNTSTIEVDGIPGTTITPFVATSAKVLYQPLSTFAETTFTRSFAHVTLQKLNTFSGDIQKARLYVRSADSVGSYEVIATTNLESVELTVTESNALSNKNYPIGDFEAQSVINSYWETGLVTSNRYSAAGTATSLQTSVELINAAHINAATLLSTESTTPRYYFRTKTPLSLVSGLEYSVSNDLVCLTNLGIEGKLEVYLSGSAFPTNNALGKKIVEYDSSNNQTRTQFLDASTNFTADTDGTATLNYVVYSGDWHYSDVHVISAHETGFNPDEAEFTIPVLGKRLERLQFKAELYDINNNLVPLTIESDEIFFDGGNVFVKGNTNRIAGSLIVAPSGSGPSISTDNKGAYIGAGGPETFPRPIPSASLATYSGPPIVTLYSGSAPFSGSATGPAVGLQVMSGTPGGAFLDFNSLTGHLVLRGDLQFLPFSSFSSSWAAVSSSAIGGDGALALSQIQQLVNGTFSGGYTFIDATKIFSPVIAGINGYISQSLGIGDIVGGKGIILTGQGYYDAAGSLQSNKPAIYIGTGRYAHANTPFLVASSSVGGIMSLGDKLTWDGSTLSVTGQINITGGNAATTAYVTSADSTLSASVALANPVSPLGFAKNTPSPSGAGLYLGSTHLGYYNGSAWRTFMDNSGNFYLGGTSGKLTWNGSTLSITGQINIEAGGNAATTAYVDTAESDAIATCVGYDTTLSASVASANPVSPPGFVKNTPSPSGAGLYLGSTHLGFYNSGWKTFMDNSGNFYLGGTSGKLQWNGSTLSISGAITVEAGGNAETTSGAQSKADAAQTGAQSFATSADTTLSSSVASANPVSPIGLVKNAPSPSGTGLFLGSTHLGFYNSGWQTYINNSGHFYFAGNASNYIEWNGSTFTVKATNFVLAASGLGIDSTTPKITLGSATAFETGTGIWLGGDGKFRAGNPAGAYIKWDGSQLYAKAILKQGTKIEDSSGNSKFLMMNYQEGEITGSISSTSSPPLVFPSAYSSAPYVELYGGITYQPTGASWSAGYDSTKPQYDDIRAENISATGFNIRARLRQKAASTARTANFTTDLTPAEGSASGPATTANAPSATNSYTCRCRLDITVTSTSGGLVTQTGYAELESSPDGSTWTSRAYEGRSHETTSTSPDSLTVDIETTVSVSGITSSGGFRWKFADDSTIGDGTGSSILTANDGSNNNGQPGVSYTTASDSFASKAPDSDDRIYWRAWQINT